MTNLISRDVLHRVCTGVGSAQEGQRLREYVEDLELRARAHEPSVAQCDHSQWTFAKHGRVCPCGKMMRDFGD